MPDVASASNANAAIQSVQNVLAADGDTAAVKAANTLAYFGTDTLLDAYTAITTTKLGYLSSITEALQAALDAAVRKTANQTISGDNTISGNNSFTDINKFDVAQQFKEVATPANSDTGYQKIYPKTTGWYVKDEAVAEDKIATEGSENIFSQAIQTSDNVGASPVGTCVATEYGDGKHHVTELLLTDFIVGALAGAAAALAVGNIIYAFPAGVHVEEIYTLSALSLKAAGTAVTTKTAIGSEIASGAVAVLNGTATFMDRCTERDIATDPAGGAAVSALTTTTAGVYTGIALNQVTDVKNVFLNSAGTWNVDNTGNLTASGTIVIKWTTLV